MNKEILKEWIELNVDADLIGTKTSDLGDAEVQYYSKETFIQALQEFNKQTNLKGIDDDVPESIGLSAEQVAESLKGLKELLKHNKPGSLIVHGGGRASGKNHAINEARRNVGVLKICSK